VAPPRLEPTGTMITANIATQCTCSGPCTLEVSPISPELRRNTFFSSVHAFRVRGATVEPLLFLHRQTTLTFLSFPTKLKFRRTFDTCLQLPHPNQACRPEMRRISTSAPIRISIFLPRISPLEMRRVSSTKARANHVDDRALKLYSV
jgi:hypothetical protein